jgi:hypothetical protein
VVFQHIPIEELRTILIVLKQILKPNGILLVSSRGYSDYGNVNVWEIISEQFIPDADLDTNDATNKHQLAEFLPRCV